MKTREIDFKIAVNKPVKEIRSGDELTTAGGKKFKVTEVFEYEGRKVFQTDRFGLIYEDEMV
ncbi:hypothetical protein [Thermoactinomyces sp. CICC 10521]|uniref:hypothetical protein n=1 Tax=Thermoactinomyces sp. CICC 10521 TaxID=2767426 RepID=UPI0018DB691F|nr:hypothetical protein [Thermoactinomyces sp. CICC 10521]MBH8609099.1 hypothetical protein [Thermoactinomyces sp. CICC 10521]